MTKQESEQVQQEAQRIVSEFGIERLDSLPTPVANAYKLAMRKHLEEATGITYETARQHIVKACRRLRHPDAETNTGWGGERTGAGRPAKVD